MKALYLGISLAAVLILTGCAITPTIQTREYKMHATTADVPASEVFGRAAEWAALNGFVVTYEDKERGRLLIEKSVMVSARQSLLESRLEPVRISAVIDVPGASIRAAFLPLWVKDGATQLTPEAVDLEIVVMMESLRLYAMLGGEYSRTSEW